MRNPERTQDGQMGASSRPCTVCCLLLQARLKGFKAARLDLLFEDESHPPFTQSSTPKVLHALLMIVPQALHVEGFILHFGVEL